MTYALWPVTSMMGMRQSQRLKKLWVIIEVTKHFLRYAFFVYLAWAMAQLAAARSNCRRSTLPMCSVTGTLDGAGHATSYTPWPADQRCPSNNNHSLLQGEYEYDDGAGGVVGLSETHHIVAADPGGDRLAVGAPLTPEPAPTRCCTGSP
ncbi:hypothetical protein GGR53DRAFT_462881 [Hypoxylon sp. FL1150]|nr:hypothetical protein GGR53DRAFT_462881 [Hypoxylon sp. FL1150]